MANAIQDNTIYDVSAAGSKLTLTGVDGISEVKAFLDDANPFQFPDVEVSGVGMNFRGSLIRYARGNPFMFSVTVCSGSGDDKALRDALKKYHISKGDKISGDGLGATLVVPAMGGGTNTYTLKKGVIVSGPMGPTATGEGKMQGNTYTFAFASCE
jgi:hypothetical protein